MDFIPQQYAKISCGKRINFQSALGKMSSNQTGRGKSEWLASRKMKATHSEDLEFLRTIRGCFGSRHMMWSVEYEFTGEELIERRGGRIKNQMRITDIIETRVLFGRNQMKLKTNNSKMTIQIVPPLNEVIQKVKLNDNILKK
ncbi:MAG: hypothetical protein ABR955_07100 [Verrucomicrobiota bacterium]|jgi:hypothetical protein